MQVGATTSLGSRVRSVANIMTGFTPCCARCDSTFDTHPNRSSAQFACSKRYWFSSGWCWRDCITPSTGGKEIDMTEVLDLYLRAHTVVLDQPKRRSSRGRNT